MSYWKYVLVDSYHMKFVQYCYCRPTVIVSILCHIVIVGWATVTILILCHILIVGRSTLTIRIFVSFITIVIVGWSAVNILILCYVIPSFQIWDYVLHVEHISCVITNCCQHQWVIPPPLNSSSDFARGKHYKKIIIPIFRLVLQNFAIPGCFPYILFYLYLFTPLSSGWFVIAVCGSISAQGRELIKHLDIVKWFTVAISNDRST